MAKLTNQKDASDLQELNIGDVEKIVATINSIIVNHIKARATQFIFTTNNVLQVVIDGKIVPNQKVRISEDFMINILRQVIATHRGIKFNEVKWKEIKEEAGGVLSYFIQNVSKGKASATLFRAQIEIPSRGIFKLTLTLEPEVRAGYGKLIDPSQLKSEEQFIKWFDDFARKLLAIKNPKPKDIIFNPNKEHPYVTITGGLREVKDIYLRPGAKVTTRIAKTLIKLANNPAVTRKLEDNGGILDTLDLDLAYKTTTGRRFRVNIADAFDMDFDNAPLITMRILPDKPWVFDQLKAPNVLNIRDWVRNLKMGLFLIAGTTGSGKSTTMCAIIDYILKSKSVNLLTIENPIETMFPAKLYPQSIISQRELGKHSINLPTALESAVRQTLNIAMVGEIRNARDCMMALELAQSGHLIFATIHAGSVGESIGRMVEMFPPDQEKKVRDMIAAQYKIGLAQILVRGIEGQVELVLEMMRMNEPIRELILHKQKPGEEKSMGELIELYAEEAGMQSLDQCMVKLVNQGRITEDELMYNSPNPDAILYRQDKLGIQLTAKWDATGHGLQEAMQQAGFIDKKGKSRDKGPKLELGI